MNTSELREIKDTDTRDFAIIGVHKGRVAVEANERDLAMGVYRVATRYLNPENALKLAEQLVSCAAGAN